MCNNHKKRNANTISLTFSNLSLLNVESMSLQLFLTFNIALAQGGGTCKRLFKYTTAFGMNGQIIDNYHFCMAVPRNFVYDCSLVPFSFFFQGIGLYLVDHFHCGYCVNVQDV